MTISRWLWITLCSLLALAGLAAVEIEDVPEPLGDRYDVSWELTQAGIPGGPLLCYVDEVSAQQGYLLRLEKGTAAWQQLGKSTPVTLASAPCKLETGKTYLVTIKRRSDTVAVLLNHRLLFTAPAPTLFNGGLRFGKLPANVKVEKARYRDIGNILFGDDFMRPEAVPTPNAMGWAEDSTWKVAYYGKDNPAQDPPTDPKTKARMNNPWQLSVFGVVATSTNGFWYLYRGVGPSWVVTSPNMLYPSADSYFVEATIRTEYDGEIGLIAAYQDNKNYLLFRWKQREYVTDAMPRAELIAVIDGQQKVLDSSTRGFDPEQWYGLRLNLGWKKVQALVDGVVLLEAANPGAIEGRAGLYANGAANARRPKLDEVTANMYVTTDEKTGRVTNDAADAMRKGNVFYFDDVRVGDWLATPDLLADPVYTRDTVGLWKSSNGVTTAASAGRLLTGAKSWSKYVASVRMKIPASGSAGLLFNMNEQQTGYGWMLSTQGQRLQPLVNNKWLPTVKTSKTGLRSGEWATLRIEADGPYVALYCNNQRVMEHFDPARISGRLGVISASAGAAFQGLTVTQAERTLRQFDVHAPFTSDKWLITWSSPEADWYPDFKPATLETPAGLPHSQIGAAAPLPTKIAGLYWHKGGHFRDLRVSLPVNPSVLSGEVIHLTTNYEANAGYRVQLLAGNPDGKARLLRKEQVIGEYPIRVTQKSRLVFERRGDYLILLAQELDTQQSAGEPAILSEQVVFAYDDPQPLKAEQIGFTVTTAALPAAQVLVQSDRITDTFEKSPAAWTSESGVWAVMARYSCQPQWNWFGGFGPNTPTVWNKTRLDGDQVVEVYLGIKMQYDNQPEEYARRYRDTNVTICADGSHLNTGYTVIRAGRPGNRVVTMLLRKGTVVQSTTQQEFLLPPQGQGHRQWFATRLEKRGNVIKVFLDNKLAMTYTDPDPIPGGYVGFWTINNGIMIGRANLSAETMTMGQPRPAAPLALQDTIDPLPVPRVTVNDIPVTIATFESGLDEWKERSGISGRLVRERVTDPSRGVNTFLKVVNMFPAGDFSVSALNGERDLTKTPQLGFDYCFDPGVQVNMYVRRQGTWYEFLLTGKEAQEPNVVTAGRITAVADGTWRHLQANLSKLLSEAIKKQTGSEPAFLGIQEIVFADWSAPADQRAYGFGNNPGGRAIRFDNFALTPTLKDKATIAWTPADDAYAKWKTGTDGQPQGVAAADTSTASATLPAADGLRFFHLQGKKADGKLGPSLHIPLVSEK